MKEETRRDVNILFHILALIGLIVIGVIYYSGIGVLIGIGVFFVYGLFRGLYYYLSVYKKRIRIMNEHLETEIFNIKELAERVGIHEEKVKKVALKKLINEYMFTNKTYCVEEIAEDLNVDCNEIVQKYSKEIIDSYIEETLNFDIHAIYLATGLPISYIQETYGKYIVNKYIKYTNIFNPKHIAKVTSLPYTLVERYMPISIGDSTYHMNETKVNYPHIKKSGMYRDEKQSFVNVLKGMSKVHKSLDIDRAAKIVGLDQNAFMKLVYETIGSGEIDIKIQNNELIFVEDSGNM